MSKRDNIKYNFIPSVKNPENDIFTLNVKLVMFIVTCNQTTLLILYFTYFYMDFYRF